MCVTKQQNVVFVFKESGEKFTLKKIFFITSVPIDVYLLIL